MSAPPSSEEPDRAKKPWPNARPLFSARATTFYRIALAAVALLIAGSGLSLYAYYHSGYWNRVGFAPAQPVLFSHRHHAAELRIDCRNCHATVETSAFAGMPSTQTCLSCHSQIFTDTPMLRPVVQSAARNVPLAWNRVTRLPDHVYFDHGIHIRKGVGCTTCHGEIGTMALTAKGEPLTMRWCLRCHRDPAPHLRPPSEIYAAVSPPPGSPSQQEALVHFYHVHTQTLTDCSTCHR